MRQPGIVRRTAGRNIPEAGASRPRVPREGGRGFRCVVRDGPDVTATRGVTVLSAARWPTALEPAQDFSENGVKFVCRS